MSLRLNSDFGKNENQLDLENDNRILNPINSDTVIYYNSEFIKLKELDSESSSIESINADCLKNSKPAVPWSYYSNTGQRTRNAELESSRHHPQQVDSNLISILQYEDICSIPATFIIEKSQPENKIIPPTISEVKNKEPFIPATFSINRLQPEGESISQVSKEKSTIHCDASIIELPITPKVQPQTQNKIKKSKISEYHPKPAVPWSYYNLQAKAHLHENKLHVNRISDTSSSVLKKMVPPRARDISTHSRISDYPDDLQF